MKRKAKVTISSLSLIFLVSSLFGGIVQADENYYDSQKSSVLDAMLNSIDYYNSATGKFVTTLINENEETTVDYQVDIDAQTAYQSVKDTVTNKESYYSDYQELVYNNRIRSYERIDTMFPVDERLTSGKKSVATGGIEFNAKARGTEERIVTNPDGTKEYRYRSNLTNTSLAGMSLFSQELTFGLLGNKENWSLQGEREFAGRTCLEIQGYTDTYYAEKLGFQTFILLVDKFTGILLDLKGYNSQNELVQYLETKEISIDEPAISTLKFQNCMDKYSDYVEDSGRDYNCTGDFSVEKVAPRLANPDVGYSEGSSREMYYSHWLIDNDTIASAVNVSRSGFPTYLTVNKNLYNGDARREVASNKNSGYEYHSNHTMRNVHSGWNVYISLSVYLYDNSFTDPAANYYAGNVNAYYRIHSVNQRTAPGGWNTLPEVSRNTSYEEPNYFSFQSVSVSPSGNASGYTGADGIRVYTYTIR